MKRDVAASVRARLLNVARSRGEDNHQVLLRYAAERFLYRLSLSPYRDRFILKGAKLFEIWTGEQHRPTQDIDFLGYGSPEVAVLVPLVQEVCRQPVQEPDGLEFLPESVTAVAARQELAYPGASLKLIAQLGASRLPVQVDFGFGDAVTPEVQTVELPSLLGAAAPMLLAYPQETVVAEKLQAMVVLGIGNSRMKDFYDLWYLSRQFGFPGPVLSRAIRATFERRKTPIPASPPLALTVEFAQDPAKRTQWNAFVRRNRLTGTELPEVVEALGRFLLPPLLAAGRDEVFAHAWTDGAWQAD
jgi:predicted nucleotidyltransferase component of viral defense system